jgi:hypothetical protein
MTLKPLGGDASTRELVELAINNALPNIDDLPARSEFDITQPQLETELDNIAATQSDIRPVVRGQPSAVSVSESQTAMDAVSGSQTAMDAVSGSQTAIDAVIASQLALDTVVASQTAMDAVSGSQTAMDAVSASQTAMDSVFDSGVALTAISKVPDANQAMMSFPMTDFETQTRFNTISSTLENSALTKTSFTDDGADNSFDRTGNQIVLIDSVNQSFELSITPNFSGGFTSSGGGSVSAPHIYFGGYTSFHDDTSGDDRIQGRVFSA